MIEDLGRNETLVDALAVLRRRWRAVALALGVALVAAATAGTYLPRQYVATTVVVAGTGSGIGDAQYVPALNDTATSLATMIVDPIVLRRAIRAEGSYDVTAAELEDRISTRVPARTPRIELSVTDRDPRRAARLANAVAAEFTSLVEDRVARGARLSASVWQPALPPATPTSPRPTVLYGLAMLLGLGSGALVAFVRERRDPRWTSEAHLERVLDLPVLAVIPMAHSLRAPLTGGPAR